ncbi:MAG TPA: hypothetical protein VIT65_23610 [Microlunatus sp.]
MTPVCFECLAHTEALCDQEDHFEHEEADNHGRVPGGECPDKGERERCASGGVGGDEERYGPDDSHHSPHRDDDAEERHEKDVSGFEGRHVSAGEP